MIWFYLIIISSVLNGLSTLIEKNALKREYATEFSSAVTPLVALISLIFIPLASFNISLWQVLLIAAWSLVNAYSYLLAARAYRHGEISATSAALGSLPTLVVVVLAFLFLSETLSLLQYIGIIGIIAATYMLFFRVPKRSSARQTPYSSRYRLIILLAIIVSGVASVLNKYAITGVNPYTFFILSSIFMSAFFTIFISLKYNGIKEVVQTIKSYRFPFSLNAVFTTGYRLSYYLALVMVPVTLAQPLNNAFYVIITVAIGGLIFREGNLRKKLVLAAFLIFFAYLLTI